MLRYFWPSDDEQLAGQWLDSHFDEDGGWWANVQQCGATLALAATLALSTASIAAATSVYSQSQDDPAGNLVVQAPVFEEYWQSAVPDPVLLPSPIDWTLPTATNWTQQSAFSYDETLPVFVQVFTPDDGDYWHQLVPPDPGSWYVSLPFLDPEEIPALSTSFPPDDLAGIWPQQPPWDPNWTLLFFLDDGSFVPGFQRDEDFWAPQIPPVVWPQPAQPFATEIDFINAFVAEEEYWQNWAQVDPGSLGWPQPFVFEQNEPPVLASFTDELLWQNPAAPVPASLQWPQQFAFEQHDAFGSLSAVFPEDGFVFGFQPFIPLPDPGGLIWPQPWLFETNDFVLSAPFADEFYWQNPTAPVVDSLQWPQQWPFEQNDPAGSLAIIFDDYFAPALVAPDPGGLLLLWQHTLQQDDPSGSLYSPIDEFYWQNPVAPVNWPQPSVFVFDESIQTFVPVFQPDMDFWPQYVAPVPALNYVVLPFSQEDDVPALKAQIIVPPPPPQPCLPPTGPDSDLTFSYFGGKTPTQVLFCRVCNSGRPLLVRGDYAIWCQDCCAFVSKQDTTMGTVQAPGQLKGIF